MPNNLLHSFLSLSEIALNNLIVQLNRMTDKNSRLINSSPFRNDIHKCFFILIVALDLLKRKKVLSY